MNFVPIYHKWLDYINTLTDSELLEELTLQSPPEELARLSGLMASRYGSASIGAELTSSTLAPEDGLNMRIELREWLANFLAESEGQ